MPCTKLKVHDPCPTNSLLTVHGFQRIRRKKSSDLWLVYSNTSYVTIQYRSCFFYCTQGNKQTTYLTCSADIPLDSACTEQNERHCFIKVISFVISGSTSDLLVAKKTLCSDGNKEKITVKRKFSLCEVLRGSLRLIYFNLHCMFAEIGQTPN